MYNFKDKELNTRNMNRYMFAKSLGMFEYEGLPETIPQVEMERQLQEKGYSFIYEHNGELYALHGGFSGELDMYDRPTKITIHNVYLNIHETIDLNDGVLIVNDDYKQGLTDLYDKYNFMLNENEISMIMNTYNNRIQQLLSASDDKTKASAEKYLNDVVKGELGIIGESQVFDGLKAHSAQANNSQSIINLIEYQQYVKATLFNEIGIDLNFNMKRERLTSGEVQQNTEMLFPLVNNMFKNRQEGIEQLNDKYNLDVTVKYGSIWRERDVEYLENTEGNTDNNIDDVEPDEPDDEPDDEKEGNDDDGTYNDE